MLRNFVGWFVENFHRKNVFVIVRCHQYPFVSTYIIVTHNVLQRETFEKKKFFFGYIIFYTYFSNVLISFNHETKRILLHITFNFLRICSMNPSFSDFIQL